MEKTVLIIKNGKCVGEFLIRLEHSIDDEDFALAARELIRANELYAHEDLSKLLFDIVPKIEKRDLRFADRYAAQRRAG